MGSHEKIKEKCNIILLIPLDAMWKLNIQKQKNAIGENRQKAIEID